MGRGLSHDVSALDSSGVLTPEACKCHFSAVCEACSTSPHYSFRMTVLPAHILLCRVR